MPPKPKTDVQRDGDKRVIISGALDIIMKHGLEGLSMRKLGTKVHMSSANIYNYFYNKDEIYLHILITGFDLLYKNLSEAIADYKDPIERMEQCVRTFIQFGVQYSSYYELMFSTKDPKSLDYVNSPVEQLAKSEKEDSLRSLTLFNTLVKECLPSKTEDNIFTCSARIICELHGLLNLYHSNVMKEIGANFDAMTEDIVHHIVSDFKMQL